MGAGRCHCVSRELLFFIYCISFDKCIFHGSLQYTVMSYIWRKSFFTRFKLWYIEYLAGVLLHKGYQTNCKSNTEQTLREQTIFLCYESLLKKTFLFLAKCADPPWNGTFPVPGCWRGTSFPAKPQDSQPGPTSSANQAACVGNLQAVDVD